MERRKARYNIINIAVMMVTVFLFSYGDFGTYNKGHQAVSCLIWFGHNIQYLSKNIL